MSEVPLRPELLRKYSQLTPERVDAFIAELRSTAVHIAAPAKAFQLPRDPDDEALTDLAIAGDAQFLGYLE